MKALLLPQNKAKGTTRGRRRKGDNVTSLGFLCLRDLILFSLALTGLQIASRFGFGVKFSIQEFLGDTFLKSLRVCVSLCVWYVSASVSMPWCSCWGQRAASGGGPCLSTSRQVSYCLLPYCRVCQACTLLEMLLSLPPDTTAVSIAAHDRGQLQVSSGTVSLGPHTCAVSSLSTESSPQL